MEIQLIIAGATQTAYNGAVNITYIDNTNFTYTLSSVSKCNSHSGTKTVVGYTSGAFIGRFYAGYGNIESLCRILQETSTHLIRNAYQDAGLPIDVYAVPSN